jgi:hypothetical protein
MHVRRAVRAQVGSLHLDAVEIYLIAAFETKVVLFFYFWNEHLISTFRFADSHRLVAEDVFSATDVRYTMRMTRITPWVFHARVGLVLCVALVCGCLSGKDRQDAPSMILSPSFVYPGDVLSLNLTVPDTNLDNCSLSNSSLVFTDPAGIHSIKVDAIDRLQLDSCTIRAFVAVDIGAATGNHSVSYQCNADTTFIGTLAVVSAPSKVTLTVNPTSKAAGTFGTTITLSAPDNAFFNDNTKILFGEEELIEIRKQRVKTTDQGELEEKVELELVIDINPLTPVGDMPITAVSAGRTAEGILRITDRVAASISVNPDRANRASLGDMIPQITDITIQTDGINFGVIDPDGGIDSENEVSVTFPGNPGISVLDGVQLLDNSDDSPVIKAQIIIDSMAGLGQTQLNVKVGANQEAWTDFTVDLPETEPLLQITSPSFVPKTGEPTPVFIEAVNFTFEQMTRVTCSPQCAVNNVVVNLDTFKSMSLTVSAEPAMTESNLTIEVTVPGFVVKEYLPVREAEAVSLIWDQDLIVQGEPRQAMRLTRSDSGEFAPETTVSVLPRSGLRIDSSSVDYTFKSLNIAITAASDAPTGPAYMIVESGTYKWEVAFEVDTREDIDAQQIFLSPGATLRRRDIALLHVSVSNFDLPKDINGFAFDDPGLRIEGMYSDAQNSAGLYVNVSPLARNDMAVLYVQGEVGQAAGSFKTLDFRKTEILTADPYSVDRMSGDDNTTTIQLGKEGILFDKPLVDVNDNVNLQLTRVSGGQTLVFDLLADEFGLGGWTGLIVENDSLKYLTAIYINASANKMLTTQFYPTAVFSGGEELNVTATLPTALTPDESVLEVVSGHPGAYVAEPVIISTHTVSFKLDVTHDAVQTGGEKIPIFITTPDGAGYGEITISDVLTTSIDVGDSLEQEMSSAAGNRFVVSSSDNFPYFFQAEAVDTTDHRSQLSLVADNALDTAVSTDAGLLWVMSGESHRIVVSSNEDSAVLVNVRSRKSVVTVDEGPNDGEEWNLDGGDSKIDPCKTPFLGRGTIQRALDVDNILMKKPSCGLIAFVAARSLSDRPWETPQLKLQYFAFSEDDWESWKNSSENVDMPLQDYLDDFGTLIGEDSGSLHGDPAFLINPNLVDDNMNLAVELASKMGSTGYYLVQIRRPYVIREFSRSQVAPFIEIEAPKADLTACELVLYNTVENSQEGRLVFADETTISDTEPELSTDTDTGLEIDAQPNPIITETEIVVIAGLPMDEADIIHEVAMLPEDGSFALILSCSGDIMDAVQIGEGSVNRGEGQPYISSDDRPTFFRIANIDTNDNSQDFAATYFSSPGR